MVDAIRVGSGFASLLPIAVSRYRTIYRGAKVAKRCTEELDELYTDLKIQEGVFLNECKILLRQSGQDEEAACVFSEKPAIDEGNAEALEVGLESYLADRYQDCKTVIERIRQAQEQVLKQLQVFDRVRNGKDENESWKKAYCRFEESIKFAFDQRKCEKGIKSLRRKNQELAIIRKQINLLRQKHDIPLPLPPVPLPDYGWVHGISNELHTALLASFSCAEPMHKDHCAFLCVENLCLDRHKFSMAIGCILDCDTKIPVRFSLEPKPVDIVVTAAQPHMPCTIRPTVQATPYLRHAWGAITKGKRKVTISSDDESDEKPAKLLTVRCTAPQSSNVGPSIDLTRMQDMCEHLHKNFSRPDPFNASIRYTFNKPSDPRYIFYLGPSAFQNPQPSSELDHRTLHEYLKARKKSTVSHTERLKLALKLVTAVLQLHPTQWFGSDWDLSRITMMRNSPDQYSLYFNANILPSPPLTPEATSDIQISDSSMALDSRPPPSLAVERGIHNETLFRLGHALTEIGHWKSLSDLRTKLEYFHYDDISLVRVLSADDTFLSKGYSEIIRKLTQCNFACANDLKEVSLQRAVHQSVICGLEDMIQSLERLNYA